MAIKKNEVQEYGTITAQQQAQAARLAAEQAAAQQAQAKAAQTTQAKTTALTPGQMILSGNVPAQATQQTQQTQQQAAATNTNNPNGINPKGIVKKTTTTTPAATTTQQAQATLQSVQSAKPQDYDSKYIQQLDSILQQIQNPEEFRWDFNGDELFKNYADMYAQNAKQASANAMGQAAALTGGYGNSYAQQVGNQAADEQMRQLYDIGMQLRDDAWDQYLQRQNQLMDQYGLLQAADATDYDRYRDQMSDWLNDRDYNYALAMNILNKGQMPSNAILAAAGLSAADAKKLMAKKSSGGGTGSKKATTYYTNVDGNLYTVENGKMVQADPSKVTEKDVIDHSIENTQKTMINSSVYGQTLMANSILDELNKNKK